MFKHHVALDSKWAWLIPIGGSLGLFFTGSVAWSFSFLIEELMKVLKTSTTVIMVGGGLLISALHIGIYPAWLCVLSTGPRTCFLIGGFFLSGAILLLVLFLYPVVYVISMSVAGFGVAFIIYSAIISIENSFFSHLALANSILSSGFSLGHIISPHFIVFLKSEYYIQELLLLTFASSLIFFPIGMLMPHEIQHAKTVFDSKESNTSKPKPDEKTSLMNSEGEQKSSEKRGEVEITTEQPQSNIQPNNFLGALEKFTTKHLVLLTIYLLSKIFTDAAESGLAFLLPLHGDKILKMTERNVAWAVSTGGISGFVGRIGLGLMSDRLPHLRHSFYIVFLSFGGIAGYIALMKFHQVSLFIAYFLYGLSHGAMTGLSLTVLSDFVGHQNFPISVVMEHLVVPLPMLATLYGMGAYYDKQKTTSIPVFIASCMVIIGSAMLILTLPIVAGYWCQDEDKTQTEQIVPKQSEEDNNETPEEKVNFDNLDKFDHLDDDIPIYPATS
jgi:MFS family permease